MTHCSILQYTAIHCNIVQHRAMHCDTFCACRSFEVWVSVAYYSALMCVPWFIRICVTIHSCVCHDSFVLGSQCIHVCDMMHSRVRHASSVWHDACTCVTCLFCSVLQCSCSEIILYLQYIAMCGFTCGTSLFRKKRLVWDIGSQAYLFPECCSVLQCSCSALQCVDMNQW